MQEPMIHMLLLLTITILPHFLKLKNRILIHHLIVDEADQRTQSRQGKTPVTGLRALKKKPKCPWGGAGTTVKIAYSAALEVEAEAEAYDREFERLEQQCVEALSIAQMLETELGDDTNCVFTGLDSTNLQEGTWIEKKSRNKQALRNNCITILNALTSIDVQEVVNIMGPLIQGLPWKEGAKVYQVDTIVAIAHRCKKCDETQKAMAFVSILNYINFTFKAEVLQHAQSLPNATRVLEEEFKDLTDSFSFTTLQKWLSNGAKMAFLAGAGSIYLLMLIAHAGKKTAILDCSAGSLYNFASIICFPRRDNLFGILVQDTLIPSIACLRMRLPCTFSMVFPAKFLLDWNISGHLTCHNLQSSDIFFDTLAQNGFVSKWCPESWHTCYAPVPSSISSSLTEMSRALVVGRLIGVTPNASVEKDVTWRHPSPMSELEEDEQIHIPHLKPLSVPPHQLITINIAYNPSQKNPCRGWSEEDVFNWTEDERSKAYQATVPKTLQELENLIKEWKKK
ncbi:hypothetical protein BDZ94DRAFT_1333489 [Collybia nuda]|uniref:Uncharacterized protein n=1 Tax=Collybia nuda TaxID=64659 RepID=A0A9P6CES0_9AGAR|nr:hypothetical protein BDZ94DRAFT_1333489 [Collybia nuda]